MKRIRMYNVGFGDCFCLRDRRSSLLVDFGTSNKKIGKRLRDEVFDRVISDLSTIPKKNLLLSHFHPDHLSGLLYMMSKKNQTAEFGRIYLPDVFSRPEMTGILTLQILADLSEHLPGRQVSLTALLEVLCAYPCRLCFLRRGVAFETKYVTLWPDMERVLAEAEAVIRQIPASAMEGWKALYELAEAMRAVVVSMSEDANWREVLASAGLLQGEDAGDRDDLCREAGMALLKRFGQIRKSAGVSQLLQYFAAGQFGLRQFKHKISIAFHNRTDGELNVLFTGDVLPEDLQRIAENYDGRIPLHRQYWSVKAPHHGTASHYFDFTPYMPDNMLISNGVYYSNSRRQERESRISGQYAGLFYIEDTTMYCSSSDNCEGSRGGCGCTCREYEIIEPRFYRDI